MIDQRLTSFFIISVLLAGCLTHDDEPRNLKAHEAAVTDPLRDDTNAANWPSYGRTNGQQHYSPLSQINQKNVARLGLAWALDLPPGNTVTQPIAVDGVIYFAMAHSVVHAVNAVSGKLLWKYDPEDTLVAGNKLYGMWGSRGIAWWQGKVYVATGSGKLIAIDAQSGKVVWSTQIIHEGDCSRFTAAPRVFEGIVIIGNSGDCGRVRGYVTALGSERGNVLWRWYVVPGDPQQGFEQPELAVAAKTWSGEWWKYGGGGNPWDGFTYDPDTGSLFVATGNGFPYNYTLRSAGKGDNLFLSSIVALDLGTGKYKWHYQAIPGENWDYDIQDVQLADLEVDGRKFKALVTAPKNGFFYVLDRTTGKLVSAKPFAKVTWASGYDLETGRPKINPEARFDLSGSATIWPSAFGAHNWQPMAFSPRTGLAYIPVVNMGGTSTDNTSTTTWDPDRGKMTNGVTLTFGMENNDPNENTAELLAWDPATQRPVWRQKAPRMIPVGVMATAGDLVFQGAIDGNFYAYSALSGSRLWSYDCNAPVLAPPIAFSVGDRQYVSVLTGTGTLPTAWGRMMSSYNIDYRTMSRRLLTFALDAHHVLPPKNKADQAMVADPDYREDTATASAGSLLYRGNCAICHGYEAVSGGNAPDLRRSPLPLSADGFKSVVKDGALLPNNMPKFEFLSNGELESIRQYIRAQAHSRALGEERRTTGEVY
jgi:quinohemoprotein ethanol dehydrogenase